MDLEEVPSSPPLFCVLRNSPYLFPSRGVLPGGACKSRVTQMDAPGTREPRGFLLRTPATTVVLEESLEVVGSTPQRTTTPPNAGTSEVSITPTGPTQTWIEQVSASCGALHGSA